MISLIHFSLCSVQFDSLVLSITITVALIMLLLRLQKITAQQIFQSKLLKEWLY